MVKPILTRLASARDFIDYSLQGLLPNREYCNICSVPRPLIQAFLLPLNSFIRLSAETVYQHGQKHQETTAEVYTALCPLAAKNGIWIKRADNSFGQDRINVFLEYQRKMWKFGIKITEYQEVYLTTLFRCEERHLRKEQRKGIILKI